MLLSYCQTTSELLLRYCIKVDIAIRKEYILLLYLLYNFQKSIWARSLQSRCSDSSSPPPRTHSFFLLNPSLTSQPDPPSPLPTHVFFSFYFSLHTPSPTPPSPAISPFISCPFPHSCDTNC